MWICLSAGNLRNFYENKVMTPFISENATLSHLPDEEIFNIAVKEQRIIITADLDFGRIFALSSKAGQSGLILFREGNLSDSQMQSFMERVLETIPPEKIQDSIIVVEHNRIRVTPLPFK